MQDWDEHLVLLCTGRGREKIERERGGGGERGEMTYQSSIPRGN